MSDGNAFKTGFGEMTMPRASLGCALPITANDLRCITRIGGSGVFRPGDGGYVLMANPEAFLRWHRLLS